MCEPGFIFFTERRRLGQRVDDPRLDYQLYAGIPDPRSNPLLLYEGSAHYHGGLILTHDVAQHIIFDCVKNSHIVIVGVENYDDIFQAQSIRVVLYFPRDLHLTEAEKTNFGTIEE